MPSVSAFVCLQFVSHRLLYVQCSPGNLRELAFRISYCLFVRTGRDDIPALYTSELTLEVPTWWFLTASGVMIILEFDALNQHREWQNQPGPSLPLPPWLWGLVSIAALVGG